jgi:hypothetical protein
MIFGFYERFWVLTAMNVKIRVLGPGGVPFDRHIPTCRKNLLPPSSVGVLRE